MADVIPDEDLIMPSGEYADVEGYIAGLKFKMNELVHDVVWEGIRTRPKVPWEDAGPSASWLRGG